MTSLSHCPLQNACLLAGGFATWQAVPGASLRATLCRVPVAIFRRGSRIYSRGLVMSRTLLERSEIVLQILTSGRVRDYGWLISPKAPKNGAIILNLFHAKFH
jgi:hypothetical protein